MTDSTASTAPKPVHTIVLDAGPILKNTPPLSTLLAQCEELVIPSSVVREIRDPDARNRVETLYLPFVKQRNPTPKSFQVLSEFSRKTGDRSVLSKTDIEVLALAYEIECERNGGDWRLRSVPGQKQVNGKPPVKEEEPKAEAAPASSDAPTSNAEVDAVTEDLNKASLETDGSQSEEKKESEEAQPDVPEPNGQANPSDAQEPQEEDDAEDSDGGGWITPSNLKKHQVRDENGTASAGPGPKVMQVATMTTDFAVSATQLCREAR